MNVQENKQLSRFAEKLSDYDLSALPCILTIVCAKRGPGDLQRHIALVCCNLIAAMNEAHCLFASNSNSWRNILLSSTILFPSAKFSFGSECTHTHKNYAV